MRKIAVLVAAGTLAAASPASATNGMRMIGFGAVQDSMGGVGVGATLDASSLLSNPAGIVGMGQRLDLTFSYFTPVVSYDATGAGPGVISSDGATIDSDRPGSPIPAIGWVRPLSDSLAVGVGVFGVAGMGVDYKTNLYSSQTLTSYLQGRFTPGVAYRLNDKLSVGVTANLMIAQMKYDVAGAMGQVEHDTATSFGIGGTVGIKYSPLEMVTIGAAYETKSVFQDFEWDIPAHTIYVPNGTGGMDPVDVPGGKDQLSFDQPQSATIGVSVSPIEALLLAVDVQWINWSGTMGDELPAYSNDTAATGAQSFNMGWDDQLVLKLGAQFSPMRGLDLRAGYNYGKTPLKKDRAFENMAFPAVAEHHVTAGASYQVSETLALNFAAMYAPEVEVSGGNMMQGISDYTTKMSQFQIDLGASYRF